MKVFHLVPMLCIAGMQAQAAPQMSIVQSGKPTAVIVLGQDATAPERYAAAELAKTIQQISGAKLPVTDKAPRSGTRIFVGQTAYAHKLVKNFDWQKLRRDGILLRTVGNDLVLAGDRPRGSIYAVQELLETQLGVRYWAPDATRIIKKSTITLPALNKSYTPKLMYREPFFTQATKNGSFAVHIRANGHHQTISEQMGGHYSLLGWCHTAYELLPPKDYFNKHPEWYGMLNGVRSAVGSQLCQTNEEMKAELIKNALGWIKKNPEAGIISITQNDWIGPCQCDKCEALVKQTGSQSGALISMVNDVAEAIEKQYPDFLVETLAYQYTRSAPKNIKPRDNVIVRLCSIENDFGRPITAASNASFYKDLKDWQKLAKRLYIWNYVVNFASFTIPHPNITPLGADLRTFTENNVVGIFEQGDNYNATAAMAPLKTYLLSKLMWNPNQAEMPIIKEFLDGYYGAAGKPMLKAVMTMEAAVQRSKGRLTCYMTSPDYYSIDDLRSLKSNFDQAEAAVKNNPTLLKRVQIQRLAIDHLLIITKRPMHRKQNEVKGVDWEKTVNHFIDLSNKTGNDWVREGGRWNAEFRNVLLRNIVPPPVYNFRKAETAMGVNGKQGVDWYDYQEDKFELFNEGDWVSVVDDALASNGAAVQMPNTHTQWAVQHSFEQGDVKWPKCDVSLEYRVILADGVQGDPQSGVLRLGVYDPNGGSDNNVILRLADVKPGYQHLVISGVRLGSKVYIYTAPEVNAAVKAIRIDRFTVQPTK